MTNTTEPTAGPPASRRLRWLLIGGGALAVVILAVAVTISVLPAGTMPTAASSQSPRPTPTGEAADSETTATGPSPTPDEQQQTTPRDATSPETQNPKTNTSPNGAAAPAPAIPAIPRDASALGALVAGFPGNVPLAQNSTVSNSSIATSGGTVQATLEAVTTTAPADVAAFYSSIFSTLGLPGSQLQAVAGSNAIAFTQGDESITLTITPTTSGSTYSLFGVLNAAS